MDKIIIPTDFSDISISTIKYAVQQFANKKEIHLIHSLGLVQHEKQYLSTYNDILIEEAKEQIAQIKKDFEGVCLRVYLYEEGLVRAIKKHIALYGTGLIVMGTHGNSRHKKRLLGSQSLMVARTINAPSLLLPVHFESKTPKSILYVHYPNDANTINDSSLKDLKSFFNVKVDAIEVQNKAFKGTIVNTEGHIVKHVSAIDIAERKEVVYGNSTLLGVLDQLGGNRYDWVVLCPRKINKLQESYDSNMTNRLLNLTRYPILVLPRLIKQ